MKDLLPGAEDWLAIGNRHCQRWPEQRGLQVRVPVAIVPRLLMSIVAAGWNQLVEDRRQIMLQARLKLNGADRGSTADIENVDRPGFDARLGYDRSDLVGEVMHRTGTLGLKGNLLLIGHRKAGSHET